jgi:hypothetical protein
VSRLSRLRVRRSYDLHHHLTTLLVCGVATVIFTRAFLAAAGYPQVGGSKFHIAHVLYGGLLLLVALICTLAFLSPASKPVAAVLGGIGFGLFIDEVGKFVTKDVNYFYKPAIAIIYVAFLALFGVFRFLARRRFTADEAVLIGLESLQRSAVGALTDERRTRVLRLLRDAPGPLADGVRSLLTQAPAEHDEPSVLEQATALLRRRWTALTAHPRFRQLIFAVLLLVALVSAVEVGWLVRHGLGDLTFSQKAFTATTVVADAALVVGAVRLRDSLLDALHWYDHAVLIEITVGQVFLYTSEQLAATLDLAGLLVLWALIRWGIHFESARH